MTYTMRVEEALAALRSRGGPTPRVALVLGSGLGEVGDRVDGAVRIPYGEIPHWPSSTAPGHEGCLVVGTLEGIPVVVMQGRVHMYEGYSLQEVTFPMRVFGRWGVPVAVLTNASGGVHPDLSSGDLVLIQDHINLMGGNPLVGPNEESWGVRFPDLSRAYDPDLMIQAEGAAREEGVTLKRGIYAAFSGPSFETPAEVRMARLLGADLVGMSTVPEVIVARHMGLRVCALSCVANPAAGLGTQELTHEEVLATVRRAAERMTRVIRRLLKSLEASHV
ncbi:MAG TPA: purine-nucleoside phosphorylase [Synergistaceae bacterium]|nr:purine-nucleoside phosphorylase [Synergistaceae bacterium]